MVTYAGLDKTLAGGLLPGGTDIKTGRDPQKEAEEQQKAQCRAAGGQWDPVGKTCIMPQKQTEQSQTPEQVVKSNVKQAGGYIDETGKFVPPTTPTTTVDFKPDGTVGYTTKEGQSFNLTREEYNTMLGKPGKVTQNIQEIKAIEGGALQQAERMQALSQLGLSQEQIAGIQGQVGEAPIDWGQALTAGLANVLPSTIGGAVGGTAIGAFAGGVGAAPGAIVGGVGGFLTGFFNGVRSNIKSQQAGEIASTQKVLTNAKSNLRQIRMIAQADPSRADEAVELYNQQMALVYQAQRKLKLETQGNLNSFMEDGTEKLMEFDLFLMPGGYADLQRQRLQEALIGGVPLTPEQILIQLQQDMESEQ